MAITRAQQFKQMLAQGGRTGFRVGTGEGKDTSGRDYGGSPDRDFGGGGDKVVMGPGSTNPRRVGPLPSITITPEPKPKSDMSQIQAMLNRTFAVEKPTLEMRAKNFVDNLLLTKAVKGLAGLFPNTIDLSGPTQFAGLNKLDKSDPFGGRDETGNRLLFSRMAQEPRTMDNVLTEEDEEKDPTMFRYLAEGGRIEAQEGGIMPRLNQLGSGVSSAEQMLQGINQRLESAESSLGGSGGNQFSQVTLPETLIEAQRPVLSVQTPDPFFGKKPLGADKPLGGMFDGKQFDSVKSAYDYAVKSAADQRAGGFMGRMVLPGEMGFEGFSNLFNFQNDPNSPQPQLAGISGIPAAGYADGGNVVGGEFDFESARQMYGLGKLVKKVTRSVKKIAKSPVGKAAILGAIGFGIPGVQSGFFSKGLAGTKFGLGPRKFLTDSILGKVTDLGIAGPNRSARVGGLLNFIKSNPMASILGASTIAGLTADDEQDDTVQTANLGPGLTIPKNQYRFLAEGGSTEKEPVAKKTMPLLDMGGMEKDYREDGGFVPIGRMEKADDVPARLSKNEFVFTADAVRNAGDGDVDKGAEVMYNMMKNLEAGGEVSEESQGLEGARRMFQTSQRLEEVL
jgi:hypothetical protein